MSTGDVVWFLVNTVTVRSMGIIVNTDIALANSDCMFKALDGISVCHSKYNYEGVSKSSCTNAKTF